MKKFLLSMLALLAVLGSGPVFASADEVAAVLEQQRQHGFTAPALAIKQLTDVSAGMDTAPLALRMRYHAALASLYISDDQAPGLQTELAQLERMAQGEQCVPCGHYKVVREIQQANRRQDVGAAAKLLQQLDSVTNADPNLMQAIHYVRAAVADGTGSHGRAIEEGIKASQLAVQTNNPAEQARAFNLLMLANIGRRDLDRAQAMAREGYALASRIGFVYVMAYIKGNEAWIYSLRNEPAKQLQALTEALQITRDHPGLSDSELVNLVNLAEYHISQKSYKMAAELAQQAVVLADKQDKATAKGVVLVSLGQAQVELGAHDKGITTAREGLALLNKVGAKAYALDATLSLSTIYESAGRQREALQTLRTYVQLKDEAAKRDRDKAIAEAQQKFLVERKDLEIERLSLESGRRQAEVSARSWQQRLWATAALALALGAVLLVQMVARARRRNRQLEVSNAELTDQSVHDPLTGAYNRRHCVALMGQQESIMASKSRERNYSAGVGLMLLDVDHFKHINDTWGHAAGDAVLVEIARRLQELVRQHDVVVRWGGEEFVLVLPGTSAQGMLVLAQRTLQVVGAEPVIWEGTAIPVTVSAGGMTFPLLPGQPWQDALKVADLAMYQAKQNGRNRAVCLVEVNAGAPLERLLGDLGAAHAAGDVVLQTVPGPVRDSMTVGI